MKSRYFVLPGILVFAGCITAVSPEKASTVNLQQTGLVLATLARRGDADDVKNVTVEFYLRPVEGRGNLLKDLVINTSRELWLIEVPFGRYRISDWFLSGGTLRDERAKQGFEFDVLPGQVTYIGHFDVAVDRVRNTFGLRVIPQAVPVITDDYNNAVAAFQRQFPALSKAAVRNAAPPRFSWEDPESKATPIYMPVPVAK